MAGDALGVPYEFKAADDVPSAVEIEMVPPEGFPRSHAGVPPGTWSDDGAQALCLLESLLERGRLDPDDLGARLVCWYDEGRLAVGGHVFDVGAQTDLELVAGRADVRDASLVDHCAGVHGGSASISQEGAGLPASVDSASSIARAVAVGTIERWLPGSTHVCAGTSSARR